MSKNNSTGIKSKNGGIMARIGEKFHEEMEDIKNKRLRNGKSLDRDSTSKITNLMIRHKLWNDIKADLIIADAGEIKRYG